MAGGLHDATRRFDDRVRAVSRPSARRQLINKPTALPYRIRVLYWPRPASSAPALFILVYSNLIITSTNNENLGPKEDASMSGTSNLTTQQ